MAFKQHIESVQTAEGLASLFVEGRSYSESQRLACSLLQRASGWVVVGALEIWRVV